MSDSKKELELFNQVITEGDTWLREHGIVGDVAHNTVVTNVYVMFPQVKYVDYLIDTNAKVMDMYVYIGFWRLLFMTIFGKSKSMVDELFYLTSDYMKTYEVRVNLRRFKGEEAATKYLESLVKPIIKEKDEDSIDAEGQE